MWCISVRTSWPASGLYFRRLDDFLELQRLDDDFDLDDFLAIQHFLLECTL
jgi:hypothetical protein